MYEKENARHLRASTSGSSSSRRTRPSGRRRRQAHASTPATAEGRLLHQLQRRQARGQLLRRQPPVLRGQRRQGDGERQGRLSARGRALPARPRAPRSEAAAGGARRARGGRFFARLDEELTARRATRSMRLTPTIVEVVVQGAGGGAQLPAGPVLPPPELRGARAAGRRHAPRRWRASRSPARGSTRRRGCSRTIVLEMGGVLAAAAPALQPGRAGRRDGPDRHADRDPGAARRSLLAGGGLGNAVLFSIAQALKAQAATGSSTSPATRRARTSSSRTTSRSAHRSGHLVHRHAAWRSRRAARRIAHFRGNIVQAMVAYAEGELGGETGQARPR